ncbi:MAG: diguanylate cyclase [Gallionellales bacterium GWA2_60_18]|nr:MAG: diguanylate cyclase [Gallionellales bacterium GWA2_60_18]
MNKQTATPSELARDTLKLLASRKLPPTPANYARIYAEISGQPAEEMAHSAAKAAAPATAADAAGNVLQWSALIRSLLRQLEATHKGLSVTRKKEGVEKVLSRFGAKPEVLFEKLDGLLHSWSEAPVAGSLGVDAEPIAVPAPGNIAATPATTAPAATPAPAPAEETEMRQKMLDLLAQTLESMAGTQPELAEEIHKLAVQVRGVGTLNQLTLLAKQLRQVWLKIELHGSDKARIQEGLVRLLRLLVENVGEMVEDEEWLHGQIAALQQIIANPIDRQVIADAERSLRDTIIKQGLLKQSLTDTKQTLKNLMSSFIDRLGEMTESTGEYHQKIETYSNKIQGSSNIKELSHLLDDIMHDTRIIQASALRSHEELLDTRKQVHEAEEKIRQLEQELAQVSELVHEDQLTGALNRRGLDEAFEREATRADRAQAPLCLAILDIDNFKRLNDTLGHQAGDQALIHLSGVIKEALRPSDSVARYGGEEFVILLPGVTLEEAAATVERLQRELTKKFFLHENDRILVTFSAGVTQRTPQEPQEDAIGRADKAMYQAKRTGKNRVVVAA